MAHENPYETILHDLRAKRDHHEREVHKLDVAIDAILALSPPAKIEALALPERKPSAAALAFDDTAEVVSEKPETPFQGTDDGIDIHSRRAAWRHQAALWNIEHYPVPSSYRSKTRLYQQALRTATRQHRKYPDWLKQGGQSLTNSDLHLPVETLNKAADFVGVDRWALEREVFAYHADISSYGVYLTDRKW